MTTTDVVLGGAIVLVVARQLRATFLAHLHADRPTTRGELARIAANVAGAVSGPAVGAVGAALTGDGPAEKSLTTWSGWWSGGRWLVSVAARLAFLVWLWDVTDGAALSPFWFAQDLVGGTVWQPVLVALSLTEVAARLGAVVVRGVTGRGRAQQAEPAVPVPDV